MWAMGCIFGELLNHSPLFSGDNDIDQLSRIITSMGSINLEDYPKALELPDFSKISFTEQQAIGMDALLPGASVVTKDLLAGMLDYNPEKRPSAKEALLHDYFFSAPPPEACKSILNDMKAAKKVRNGTGSLKDSVKDALTKFESYKLDPSEWGFEGL